MLPDSLPSFPSKQQLLDGAAYASLFIAIAGLLWPKFVHLVEMIAADVARWIEGVAGFRKRLRVHGELPPQPASGNGAMP